MKIEVYGNCTQCHLLHEMLEPPKEPQKHIPHEHITDAKAIEDKANEYSVMYAPMVFIDGKLIDHKPHAIVYFRLISELIEGEK